MAEVEVEVEVEVGVGFEVVNDDDGVDEVVVDLTGCELLAAVVEATAGFGEAMLYSD